MRATKGRHTDEMKQTTDSGERKRTDEGYLVGNVFAMKRVRVDMCC